MTQGSGNANDHVDHRSRRRVDRRQRGRLCPCAACRRDSGRPGRGHRCDERVAGDRDRQPRRCLCHARSDLRHAPRARADLRAGVRPVLPRRRGMEAHAGLGAAAGARQKKAAAGLAPRPGSAVAGADARSPAGPGAGTQARGLGQGDSAEEGFRPDERGRNRASDPRHRTDEIAAGRVAHPPLPA